MTKEELEKEAEKHADGIYHYKINVSDYGEDGIINYRYSDVKEAYQKGAEPREKRIAELEQKLEQTEKDLADYQFNYPTIKELEKENAELKEKLERAERARDYWKDSSFDWRHKCTSRRPFRVAVKAQKQLTKAKEIIREFVEWATWQGSNCPSFKSIQDKAEQFLKDLEK